MDKHIIKMIAIAAAVGVLLLAGVIVGVTTRPAPTVAQETEPPTEAPKSHMIDVVPATLQETLKAGCETHACTSLLQTLGYDIDEYRFADNYLECHYVIEDEVTGEKLGPDMNSGFAGTAYAGWGIYAPAMAKCMNRYLVDAKSEQKAYVLENKTLEDLCEEYIDNDIPVMVWATTDMQEPIEWDIWTVNYVDENAKYKEGETFRWMYHEHCLVLCGYDKDYYYFSDSVAGGISHFAKDVSEKRYEQLDSQAIVVK